MKKAQFLELTWKFLKTNQKQPADGNFSSHDTQETNKNVDTLRFKKTITNLDNRTKRKGNM